MMEPWPWAGAVAPLLAPFVISLLFVVLYCGPNLRRGLACIVDSRLGLASGPKVLAELGSGGRRVFSTFDLGEHISRVILRNCNGRPRWWSLDFWVNPDAQDRIEVANLPSGGTREGIARLFKEPKDPAHVDLAIIQDGLIVDGDLAALDVAQADQIQGLVHLYKSVFCAFARRGSPTRRSPPCEGMR